jgi:hypothetical protein
MGSMGSEIEPRRSHTIVRKVAAGAVLIIAGVIAIHLLLGLVMTFVYVALAIALIVAVVWAVNALF